MSDRQPRSGLSTAAGDYDEAYYRNDLGLPYDESEGHWARFFGEVADRIIQQVQPSTVLDVGCAKGFLVAALVDRGVEARGVDVSDYAIESAVERIRDRVSVHDLTQPLDGRYDLVTCVEVLEHMGPADALAAMDNICSVTDHILFSSTPLDYEESTHVNVQPIAKWVEAFAQRGFYRRADLDATYLSQWAMVFERRDLKAPDVAYLYECELAPMRAEVFAKRQALLEARRQAEAATLSGRQSDPGIAGVDRVLALTDQVIGLQAELAETRYHIELAPGEVAGALPEDNRIGSSRHLQARLATEVERRQTAERRAVELGAEADRQRLRADHAEDLLQRLARSRSWRAFHALAGLAVWRRLGRRPQK